MSLADDLWQLMMSDVSAAAVDQLVTRQRLWLLNNWAHFSVPFVGFHLWHHFPRAWYRPRLLGLRLTIPGPRRPLIVLAVLFLLFQVIQMFASPFNGWVGLSWLIWDNLLFDPALALAGGVLAFVLAARGIER